MDVEELSGRKEGGGQGEFRGSELEGEVSWRAGLREWGRFYWERKKGFGGDER